MRDTAEILDLFTSALASGRKMVMATVVDVSGSAYRRPGAHLLLVDDGRKAGSISAGCLESDILARGEEIFTLQQCLLLRYDNDEFFGLNYGCDGTIHVLLQPVSPSGINFPTAFERANQGAKQLTLATIFDCEKAEFVGSNLLYVDGKIVASELPRRIEQVVASGMQEVLRSNLNQKREYNYLNTKVFFEQIKPAIRLAVFGAGDDAIPLLTVARSIGMDVHLIDSRRSYLDRNSELATIHHFGDEFDAKSFFNAPERTAAVVISHHFELDKRFLNSILQNDCAYIGLMGSRKRCHKLLAEIDASDSAARIHFPIGLDLGAETPEEIALSIASEILSFFRRSTAQPLSRTSGPVHRRIDVPERNRTVEEHAGKRTSFGQCTAGGTDD